MRDSLRTGIQTDVFLGGGKVNDVMSVPKGRHDHLFRMLMGRRKGRENGENLHRLHETRRGNAEYEPDGGMIFYQPRNQYSPTSDD